MSIEYEFGSLAREMEKDIKLARKKAARKVGPKLKKERIEGLKRSNAKRKSGKGISPERKKKVKAIYGKDGLLVFLDLAQLARAQEFGQTIRASGSGKMFIQDRRRREQLGDKTFVRNDLVFAVKAPEREAVLNKRTGKIFHKITRRFKPRIIASLRKQIRIARLPKSARMIDIAERGIDEYENEIIKALNS